MSASDPIEETMPSQPAKPAAQEPDSTQPNPPSASPRPKRWRWILGGLALFVLLAGLGALVGYQTAVSERQAAQRLQSAVEANYQFQLAVADIQNGACDRAKDRLVYVIELVPDYPGAQDLLIQASMCTGSTAGDTSGDPEAIAPEATPTPDLRGAETVYSDAQAQLAAQNWEALLPLLDTLRKNYPDYQPLEVDRMYYLAYRNRGIARIQSGNLEPGIFDLNQSEKVGPLDKDGQYWRTVAVNYLVGLSFWEIDWPQAVQYFSYVKDAAPSLFDSSFISATDRYTTAIAEYAKVLVQDAQQEALQKQWCTAADKYGEANSYSALSPEDQVEWERVNTNCAETGNE